MVRSGESLGEFEVLRELSSKSLVAQDRSGRRLVLKLLESDCLLDGQLHPSIRLRLTRVSQLPSKYVANLHGVGRDRGMTYLIWDYVPGRTLAEVADRRRWRRELEAAVQSLHSWGIVHGSIHANNVIVDERGRVVLTHLSPLLFNDEQKDWLAVEGLMAREKPAGSPDVAAEGIRWRSLLWATAAIIGGIIVALAMAYFARPSA